MFVAAGLALAALVRGGALTVEFAMNALAAVRGLHATIRVTAADVALEPTPAHEVTEEVAPPLKPSAVRAAPRTPCPTRSRSWTRDMKRVPATPAAASRADLSTRASTRACPGAAPRAVQPGAAYLVDALYAPIVSFRSRFDEEARRRCARLATRSHGTLVVAKPGKMSWSYDDPENSRIVSDGQTVSVYEAPNKHLFRVPLDSSPYPGAFAFLTGQAPLTALFDLVARNGEATADSPGICMLVGTPRALTRAYQKVLFHVNRATLEVRRVVIVDRAGDRNRINLVDPSMDMTVNPDQFVFVPPSDTIVVGR